MARKNNRINIDTFDTQYYSDPDHPEVYKIVDMDQKTVFINAYGDYDGIIKLVNRKGWE